MRCENCRQNKSTAIYRTKNFCQGCYKEMWEKDKIKRSLWLISKKKEEEGRK